MYPDWLNNIDEKRRKNLVQALQELSRLQDKDELSFIIVGALPLLMKGYLHYQVYWDIDILFKDNENLTAFIQRPKSEGLRIVDYDDALMVNRNISSFHTAWAFDNTWFNVDYILRKGFFEYYTHDIDILEPHKETVQMHDEDIEISLYMAHPWDIIVEKVFSPRTARDIELKVDTSVDIRHILAVYSQEKDNIEFWNYVFVKAELLQSTQEFKVKFLEILSSVKELGYTDFQISDASMKTLKSR